MRPVNRLAGARMIGAAVGLARVTDMVVGPELAGTEYAPIPWRPTADGMPALASRVLGLELHVTEDGLRFLDPATGKYLTSHAQAEARAAAAEAQSAAAQAQAVAAQAQAAAEARVAELEARLRDHGDTGP